jgi:hypothetical protein
LVSIWNACRDDDHCRIIRLLVVTGQRRGEVAGMARMVIRVLANRVRAAGDAKIRAAPFRYTAR